MKIAVIEGSIRAGRKAAPVAQWVMEAANKRDDAEFELLRLVDFNLPLFDGAVPPGAANRNYDSAEVTKWSQAIDAVDALIIISPEYNHGIPGALKNAIDSIGPEFQNKVAAVVGYGADGGVRATEQLRLVLANFNMYVVRNQISLNLFTEFSEDGLQLAERRDAELSALLDAVVAATAR